MPDAVVEAACLQLLLQGDGLAHDHSLGQANQHRPGLARATERNGHQHFNVLCLRIEQAITPTGLDIAEHFFPGFRQQGLDRLANQVGPLAVRDHQALVTQDRNRAFAAVEISRHLLAEFLDKRDIEVSPDHTVELAVGHDGHRQGGQPDVFPWTT